MSCASSSLYVFSYARFEMHFNIQRQFSVAIFSYLKENGDRIGILPVVLRKSSTVVLPILSNSRSTYFHHGSNFVFAQIADNELNRSMQKPQFLQAAQFKALSTTQASGNEANMKR